MKSAQSSLTKSGAKVYASARATKPRQHQTGTMNTLAFRKATGKSVPADRRLPVYQQIVNELFREKRQAAKAAVGRTPEAVLCRKERARRDSNVSALIQECKADYERFLSLQPNNLKVNVARRKKK